jgi:NitT/TauT family transport system substrate-binding protein
MGQLFKRASLLAAAITIAIVIGACNKKAGETIDHVTYRLKWIFNISVIGDLYADVHGFFADQGLQVTIKEGGPERDAIKELELGHAQFGVASADQVIRALSKGAPVMVISQLFQANPLQWIYRPERIRIERPEDLKGKTIGITYGGNDETIMRALLAKYNIRDNEVKFFSVRYDYTPFYEGKVDLWPVYQNAEGIVIGEKLRRAGEEVKFFDPDVFGIRFVANSVITTEYMLKERPGIVRKFTTALLRGWREALNPKNKEKAVTTIHEFDKDTPIEIIRKQLAATRILMAPSPEIEVGGLETDGTNHAGPKADSRTSICRKSSEAWQVAREISRQEKERCVYIGEGGRLHKRQVVFAQEGLKKNEHRTSNIERPTSNVEWEKR